MSNVGIADRRIHVGRQSRALLSGEVHYWRLEPSLWPTILRSVRALGLDVLSTYVAWNFHERAPGEYDFVGRGEPRRNLLGFLELAQREGFWVLLRPGPYIYAEWPHSGIPERFVQWHRLHPNFKRAARGWMSAVVQAARPYLATVGGPIVLWQADNEADPWADVYGSQLGLDPASPGLFDEFLTGRYGQAPERVAAVQAPIAGLESEYEDFARFRHWYAAEIIGWTTETYRQLGIDVPITANTYSGWTVQNWRDLQLRCDLVGPDLYPTAEITTNPGEMRQFQDAVRYARTTAPLAFIAEFEAGIWHGWHRRVGVLSATHTVFLGLSALQAGASGWNWYMLVNRDNWYMSPINEAGVPRPDLAPAYRELVELFRALDPPALDKLTGTAVTFDVLTTPDEPLLQSLHAADIEYEFFDVDSGHLATPLVLYGSGRTLSAAAQAHLTAYVENGGSLVFFQTLPPNFGLCLPEGVTTAAEPQRLRVELGEHAVELSSAAAFSYAAAPGVPIRAARVTPRPPTQEGGYRHVTLPIGETMTVGYVLQRGRGRMVVVGLTPSPDLLLALHAWLGVGVPITAATPSIRSALFRRADRYFAIVLNSSGQSLEARLKLTSDSPLSVARDLRTGREYGLLDGELVAEVSAGSGTVLELTGGPPSLK
ncbi:MAG TPA: beta-galactosidase [Chloroflexota bacterium]|nr:beta-galactosidase [Chloroflexota bacterium]